MNENMCEALRYTALGWKVYPVWGIQDGKCLCGGLPNCKPGKHPWGKAVQHGGKDATCDTAKLKSWFVGKFVNVGIRVDEFIVLDVENRNSGMELLAAWEQQHGKMPTTPTAESRSGGRHFYFKRPGNLPEKEKLPIASGAELLVGGDVIAPPSNHYTGGKYRWLVEPETPLAEIPVWLMKMTIQGITLKPTPPADEPFDPMKGTISRGETFAELGNLASGNRSTAVNAVIGSMIGHGFTREQILETGRKWAVEQEPPYSEADLEGKIEFFAHKQFVQIEERAEEPLAADEKTTPTVRSSQFAGSQATKTDNNPTPVMPSEVFYGVVGEFVRAVEPLTEADPYGVLACVLTGVGNALGRSIHHNIGRRHSGNLFTLLVGNTASRKGTCWSVAESLLSPSAPEWAMSCVEHGFGSGQGFVSRVEDAREGVVGVPDKRLMVIEEEWAKPLRLCRSENSILSPLIRSAFDGAPLAVMNRGENRYGCREPHVSIIGMITGGELLSLIKRHSELVNGTINRFLIVNCERHRHLAFGGDYSGVGKQFAPKLRAALEAAKTITNPMTVDAEAREMWRTEYRRLEQQREGDHGSATSRLSVHCLKVAMIYAALDGSPVIRLPHLKAALAFVDYCDKSALKVFDKPSKPPTSPPEEPHERAETRQTVELHHEPERRHHQDGRSRLVRE